MSIRLEMLQVARLAPKELGEATELVSNFLLSSQNPDGGFGDREGRSDLYYTVFGVEGLVALQKSPDLAKLAGFLKNVFVANLDFVHLCCLARCWACCEMLSGVGSEDRNGLAQIIERFRANDGGYHLVPGSDHSTVYASFLALGAFQDLRMHLPESQKIVEILNATKTSEGSWANERTVPVGSTNSTAAAVTMLHALGAEIPKSAGDWLLAQAHPKGGFIAAPGAPLPDLLSTATTLHALAIMQHPMQPIKEPTLDFVDTLWTNEGGFFGHWADEHLDCEYTYYGLLALGHLSVI